MFFSTFQVSVTLSWDDRRSGPQRDSGQVNVTSQILTLDFLIAVTDSLAVQCTFPINS